MGDTQLTVSESAQNGFKVIALTGDLDAHTVSLCKTEIDRIVGAGAKNVVFDFTALKYISSAGIGILNATLNALKAKGGSMTIGGASKAVTDTLDLLYFTKKVQVFSSLADAFVK